MIAIVCMVVHELNKKGMNESFNDEEDDSTGRNSQRSYSHKTDTPRTESNAKRMTCNRCNLRCKSKEDLKAHIDKDHIMQTEQEFNCKECDFQATRQLQINKHFNLKHKLDGQRFEGVIQCNICLAFISPCFLHGCSMQNYQQ